MIAASFRSDDVLAIVNSAHSMAEDHPMESTGVRLERNKSRRRFPQERPHFNENDKRILRSQKGLASDEQGSFAKVRVSEIRRSKSLHAKAGSDEKTPDGQRGPALPSWHILKSSRRKRKTERSAEVEIPARIEDGTSTESLVFSTHERELNQSATETLNEITSDNKFIKRLVSVIGDISCPIHPDRSIQSCPRECGWHIEHHIEGGKANPDEVEELVISRSDSSTLVPSSSTTDSIRSPISDIHINPIRYPFRIRPCYVLIVLGILSIVGSLTPAIWRANVQGDLSGGFTLAQYILGVGIFIVGSMVAIHSRTCVCWHT